jgi:hypothetical protein
MVDALMREMVAMERRPVEYMDGLEAKLSGLITQGTRSPSYQGMLEREGIGLEGPIAEAPG